MVRAIAVIITAVLGATAPAALGAGPLRSESFRVGQKLGCAFLVDNEPILRCDALFLNDVGFLLRGVDRGERITITDTIYNPRAPRLKSGRTWARGPFRCTASGTTKVTCRDRQTRHGFVISPDRQRVF